jgi:ankyrin repeat protein
MGHMHIVKFLIEEAGVDPNSTDHYGNTVLHVLAFWGYYNDTLARDSSNPSYQTSPEHQELGGIYLYLKGKCDPSIANRKGMTPLHVAVWKGKEEMVRALLNHQRQTLWVFGKSAAYLYDLTELDTYVDLYTMNHTKGALEIAIREKVSEQG